MFRLVYGLRSDGKDVEGGRSVRECDEDLYFSEKKTDKVWNYYMERIMIE